MKRRTEVAAAAVALALAIGVGSYTLGQAKERPKPSSHAATVIGYSPTATSPNAWGSIPEPTPTFGPPSPPTWRPGGGVRPHIALLPAIAVRGTIGGGLSSEMAHVLKEKKCGAVKGPETWKKNTVKLKLSKCVVTGVFSIRRLKATPKPIPTLPPPPTVEIRISTPTPVPTDTPVPAPTDATHYLLGVVNEKRQSLGVAPLELNVSLSSCAYQHSINMAAQGGLYHGDFCMTGTWGQNAGYDYPPVDQGVLSDFNLMMGEGHQPLTDCVFTTGGHDCNLMYRGFRQIGIGIYEAPNGVIWITENFES